MGQQDEIHIDDRNENDSSLDPVSIKKTCFSSISYK